MKTMHERKYENKTISNRTRVWAVLMKVENLALQTNCLVENLYARG